MEVGGTAAVLCAVLIKHGGVWHADLAFEQFYVSDAWIQHLLDVFRTVSLPAYAQHVGKDWYVNGKRVHHGKWEEAALALSVQRAGYRDAHVIYEAGREPAEWRLLLDSVSLNEEQWRYFGTLQFLESLHSWSECLAPAEKGPAPDCVQGAAWRS